MSRIILLNKPFGVLCQFTAEPGRKCLKHFIPVPGFYPAGRLDADSEGLVLLTDDGRLQNRISHPRYKFPKSYWVQVEGRPDETALNQLRQGIKLKDFTTQPAQVGLVNKPDQLWERTPPIRFRKNIPTSWLALTIKEGKNRQVRRMTAAVSFPTLRLVRFAIGSFNIEGLVPGEWRMLHYNF